MAAKIQIFILQTKSRDQNLNNHFSKLPKEFFDEILVKVGEHVHIYIAKI